MKLLGLLALFSALSMAPVVYATECTCDDKCIEACEHKSGDHKDCKCDCGCKEGKCTHKKCTHHKDHGKKETKEPKKK